jgi:hypothetical protein
MRVIVFLLFLTACASGSQQPETPDVTEWQHIGAPVWQVDNGVITAGPHDGSGFLVSNDEYGDFRLSVEFWVEDDTNSGIFVRCTRPVELADINPDNCYEINIWDNHPVQDFRTGSIVKRVVPLAHVDTVGKWNRLVIVVKGQTISVVINDVLTAELPNAERSSGVLALQYAGKQRLSFRNLLIVPL